MRAKNEYKFIEEAYSQVNEGLDKIGEGPVRRDASQGAVPVDPGIKNQSLLHHSERAALRRGEQLQLPTVNDVPEALEALKHTGITGPNNAVKWMTRVIEYNNIEVPPKYRPIEAIVKAAMKRKRSEDQEDDHDPDETALGKAFLASQTAEGPPNPGPDDLGPDRSEEQETHKPYVSSYMPFHRNEDDKLKPSKKIWAVLNQDGTAIFTSNDKDEAYKWFDDNFKDLRNEDDEYDEESYWTPELTDEDKIKDHGPVRQKDLLTPKEEKEIDEDRAKLHASKVKSSFGKKRWE